MHERIRIGKSFRCEVRSWASAVCLAALGAAFLGGCRTASDAPARNNVPRVTTVPDSLRHSLNLAPFYQKYLNAGGLPVLGSTNVSDYAMREAAWIVQHMLAHRPEILGVMATNRARLVVMAYNEYTTDVPEQAGRSPKVWRSITMPT